MSIHSTAPDLGPDTLYKLLGEDGRSLYASYQWPLPNGKPTKWQHAEGDLVVCENGIHLAREQDILGWLGPALFVAEAKGARIDSDDKIVVRSARLLYRVETWNEKGARLFACDCAERALRRVTAKYGKQGRRSWAAIRMGRRFARGEVDREALRAALAAAYAAVHTAAYAVHTAAYAAAYAAAAAAADAAATAAAAAATAAAAAAYAAAAERKWQTQRLMEYLRGER